MKALSTKHFIFVCQRCLENDDMLHKVQQAFAEDAHVEVRPQRCMGGCDHMEQGCGYTSIAFQAQGKDGILLHQLTSSDDDILLLKDFFEQYRNNPLGTIRIKKMTHPRAHIKYFMARIPGLPSL